MNIVVFIAQALGIAAMILTVLSMQCRSNRNFFICQEIAGAVFLISFCMLGAWSGAVMNLFGIIRPELLRNRTWHCANCFCWWYFADWQCFGALRKNGILFWLCLLRKLPERILCGRKTAEISVFVSCLQCRRCGWHIIFCCRCWVSEVFWMNWSI